MPRKEKIPGRVPDPVPTHLSDLEAFEILMKETGDFIRFVYTREHMEATYRGVVLRHISRGRGVERSARDRIVLEEIRRERLASPGAPISFYFAPTFCLTGTPKGPPTANAPTANAPILYKTAIEATGKTVVVAASRDGISVSFYDGVLDPAPVPSISISNRAASQLITALEEALVVLNG
jgi:hypothetical protein